MSDEDPISLWLHRLNDGDSLAAEKMWNAYFGKLQKFARRRLRDMPRRAADEEDVAVSAFNSFIQGARAERFPKLEDRDDLWKILITITARKTSALQRRHFAAKRGAGRVDGESKVADDLGFQNVIGKDPTPEMIAQMEETFSHLLSQIDDSMAREIAIHKFEGFTNREIAVKLGCSERTVDRKLTLVRATWRPMNDEQTSR